MDTKIQHALISVSDKTGIAELATVLKEHKINIYSTGGTAKALRQEGIDIIDVSEFFGIEEMFSGRVKTLHPKIHAGILANMDSPEQQKELKKLNIPKIDLVIVNFYPFEKVINSSTNDNEIIENIDIGGPTMVRAAAKNYRHTTVITDISDYPVFIGEIKKNNAIIDETYRRQMATKAFTRVAHLDITIANHFSKHENNNTNHTLPHHFFLHLKKIADLPYGENPHQRAGYYSTTNSESSFTQIQGDLASYNNILDMYSACRSLALHDEPTVAIIKHNNPCGLASASTLKDALAAAIRCDPLSAFGGVVAVNRPLDGETAQILQKSFWEVVIAPQFHADAKSILAVKDKLRLLTPPHQKTTDKQIIGQGEDFLLQDIDEGGTCKHYTVESNRQPSHEEMEDLRFAWKVAASVKSNAIVITKNKATLGIGAGQMSRLDSAWLACEKARRTKINIKGAVAASDGFFPFADGLERLAAAGISAIIQPGGSKNDDKVIAVANAQNIVLLFTRQRHFRH